MLLCPGEQLTLLLGISQAPKLIVVAVLMHYRLVVECNTQEKYT
jgi:hypothetical protein